MSSMKVPVTQNTSVTPEVIGQAKYPTLLADSARAQDMPGYLEGEARARGSEMVMRNVARGGVALSGLGKARERENKKRDDALGKSKAYEAQAELVSFSSELKQLDGFPATQIAEDWSGRVEEVEKLYASDLDPDARVAFDQQMTPFLINRSMVIADMQYEGDANFSASVRDAAIRAAHSSVVTTPANVIADQRGGEGDVIQSAIKQIEAAHVNYEAKMNPNGTAVKKMGAGGVAEFDLSPHVKERIKAEVSNLHMSVLEKTSRDNSAFAREYFEAHKGDIDPKSVEAMKEKVDSGGDYAMAQSAAEEAFLQFPTNEGNQGGEAIIGMGLDPEVEDKALGIYESRSASQSRADDRAVRARNRAHKNAALGIGVNFIGGDSRDENGDRYEGSFADALSQIQRMEPSEQPAVLKTLHEMFKVGSTQFSDARALEYFNGLSPVDQARIETARTLENYPPSPKVKELMAKSQALREGIDIPEKVIDSVLAPYIAGPDSGFSADRTIRNQQTAALVSVVKSELDKRGRTEGLSPEELRLEAEGLLRTWMLEKGVSDTDRLFGFGVDEKHLWQVILEGARSESLEIPHDKDAQYRVEYAEAIAGVDMHTVPDEYVRFSYINEIWNRPHVTPQEWGGVGMPTTKMDFIEGRLMEAREQGATERQINQLKQDLNEAVSGRPTVNSSMSGSGGY